MGDKSATQRRDRPRSDYKTVLMEPCGSPAIWGNYGGIVQIALDGVATVWCARLAQQQVSYGEAISLISLDVGVASISDLAALRSDPPWRASSSARPLAEFSVYFELKTVPSV
jgi:hypothetical protein